MHWFKILVTCNMPTSRYILFHATSKKMRLSSFLLAVKSNFGLTVEHALISKETSQKIAQTRRFYHIGTVTGKAICYWQFKPYIGMHYPQLANHKPPTPPLTPHTHHIISNMKKNMCKAKYNIIIWPHWDQITGNLIRKNARAVIHMHYLIRNSFTQA